MKPSQTVMNGRASWPGAVPALWLAVSACFSVAATVNTESEGLTLTASEGATSCRYEVGNRVVVSFGPSMVSPDNPPDYAEATLLADAGQSGPFSGDYIAAGVKGVRLRIRGDGHQPGSLQVLLQGTSGRIWINSTLRLSSEPGVWTTIVLPFERSAGWLRGGTDLDTKWQADLRSVRLMGVRLSRGGTEAQSYALDDFVLLDADGMYEEENLSPLEKALLARFGVRRPQDVSEADRLVDSDQDGMTDWTEILCLYDPDFANAMFVAEILSVTDAGVLLRWPCVQGSTYTVVRSLSLLEGFSLLPGNPPAGADLFASDTGYMLFLDTDAAGKSPLFYRIRRQY